jgi:flagellar hook-associated protein 2
MSSAVSSSTTTPATTSATSGSSTGNALITSTGIGSGLDISAIVSELTTAEGSAQQTQLTDQQNSLNAQISAFGTFSSALSTLQATLTTLETPSQLSGFTATVGATSVASASAGDGAVAGTYSLEVQNLATAATLTSQPVASAATTVGTGTLQISVGGASTAVDITSADDTLAGIAAAINGASNNPGVTATIITASDGARLVLSGSATGAANAITVTETDGGTGLAAVTNLTQTQAATDANFTINGYAATSASNVVTGAISGVTLNLLAPSAANTPTTLTIAPNTANAQTSIGTFVTALNGVLSAIQSLSGYDASTQTAGALNGNPTIEAFQNQLENILDSVTSGNTGVNSLADLGITADANTGELDTNSTTLGNALDSNLSAVASFLGGTNGLATKIGNLVTQYTQAGGLLASINQGLQTGLTNVATQQTELNAELATYSATLTTQYNAMDAAVAALKQTETYLTAEFNPSSSSSSSSSSNTSLGSGTLST